MQQSAVELAKQLIAEGRPTSEIQEALARAASGLGSTSVPTASPQPSALAASSPPAIVSPPSAVVPPPPPAIVPSPTAAPLAVSGLPAANPPAVALPAWRDRSWAVWAVVGALCLLPALLMCLDAPWSTRFGGFAAVLLTLGDITGVIGLALYAVSLVMAMRLRIIEDWFGGLNRVLLGHQVVGSLALVMVLAHPLLTAASYYRYGLYTVAHFFVPQVSYLGTAYGIFALIMFVLLMVFSLFVRLGYRTWLTTHKFLGLAYALIALHILFTPNHITADLVMRWYLYVVTMAGAAAYVYRSLMPNIFVRRYLYTIASAAPRGVGVVEVTLRPVGRSLSFKAGQFVFMAFENDALSGEWHPFSISSAETSNELMLDVRSLGAYTETLTRLLPDMVGMTVQVEGAYGRFSFQNFGNLNQVWVAGGIGITPFLSMAQGLGQGPYNIDLYYSVKTEQELIDLEILSQCQSNVPGRIFRVFPYITEKYNSHLSAQVIAGNTTDLSQRDILLCGPPPMMASLRSQLEGLGVPPRHIHSEEFSL